MQVHPIVNEEVDLVDLVCTGSLTTYLHLIALISDIPLDTGCIERCRIILSRLISSIKSTDLYITIMLHEAEPEQSNNKKYCS